MESSCPRLSRASTSSVQSKTKTWMAGTSPAMTSVCFNLNRSYSMDHALSCAGRRHGENRIECFRVLGRAQLVGDRRIAQEPRHPRQRLQMIGAGAFRRQQKENQIDRLAVERFEVDRPIEPREQPEQTRQMRHLAMRYGDAVADRS